MWLRHLHETEWLALVGVHRTFFALSDRASPMVDRSHLRCDLLPIGLAALPAEQKSN
jgi:hypothetical protein